MTILRLSGAAQKDINARRYGSRPGRAMAARPLLRPVGETPKKQQDLTHEQRLGTDVWRTLAARTLPAGTARRGATGAGPGSLADPASRAAHRRARGRRRRTQLAPRMELHRQGNANTRRF